MKKEIIGFIVLILYIFSVIYVLGWSFYDKHYVAAAAVVFIAVLAFPKMKELFKKALGKDE